MCGGVQVLPAGIQEGLHGVVLRLAFPGGEDINAGMSCCSELRAPYTLGMAFLLLLMSPSVPSLPVWGAGFTSNWKGDSQGLRVCW